MWCLCHFYLSDPGLGPAVGELVRGQDLRAGAARELPGDGVGLSPGVDLQGQNTQSDQTETSLHFPLQFSAVSQGFSQCVVGIWGVC